MRSVRNILRQRKGSTRTVLLLSVVTILIIFAGIRMTRTPESPTGDIVPQAAQQLETRAFYIAQTALDRSIKALVADPEWRDGFDGVPFETGTYNVKVFDANTDVAVGPKLPQNYVRIVASSEVEGVVKEVEAVWVDAMSAFHNTYSAGDRLEFANHGADDIVVLGKVHNNSWNRGAVTISDGTRIYGDLTSTGPIEIGAGTEPLPCSVFGSVWGSRIDMSAQASIDKFESLSEWTEGIDLNNDGDANDIGLSGEPIQVVAYEELDVDGRALLDTDTHSRIGGGSVRVSVGGNELGPIIDPRPDFATYYEIVSGGSTYPPSDEHVTTHILGDGEGHYFGSAEAFIEWLTFQNDSGAYCWRCAGDERIDPGNTTLCTTCNGTGRQNAVEVSGIFYVDDEVLDLSNLGRNLIVHGTIVICEGDPYEWPAKTIQVPGGEAEIAHFPQHGSFIIKGANRMNFTHTYRSDEESADYTWRGKTVLGGQNAQTLPVPEPSQGHFMKDYPAIVAADRIVIEPRGAGFAYHPGDIGDERLTIVQGVIYGENEVRLHGHGGWSGEALIFDEMLARSGDDALDEPVLNIDLNGDNDVFDRVELSGITTIPVVPVSDDKYGVDINNDGVLGEVPIGVDYLGFFRENGYAYPVLVYVEGLVLGNYIHSCEQALVIHDADIAAGVPFGFEVSFGTTTYQGLVFWTERDTR